MILRTLNKILYTVIAAEIILILLYSAYLLLEVIEWR